MRGRVRFQVLDVSPTRPWHLPDTPDRRTICITLIRRICQRVRDGSALAHVRVGPARLSPRARDWLYRFCAVAVSRHLVAGVSARVL